MLKNILKKNGKCLGRVMLTVYLAALFALTGCDKKDVSTAESEKEKKNAAAQEIIRKAQEPIEKVRELEQQLLERDERNKKLADQM